MENQNTFLKRAVKNFSFSGVGTLANLVLGFLFAGFTVRYLGDARAGYFMALASLTGLNALVGDFGLGVPATRRVAVLNAERNFSTARKIVGSVCTANLVSSLLIAVPVFIGFAPIFRWTRLAAGFQNDAFWAMAFTLFCFVITQSAAPWRSTYNALERYDLISGIDSIFGLLSGICCIGILIVVPTMSALALTRLILCIGRSLIDIWFVRRLLHGMIWPTWRWRLIKPLMGFGTWVYIGYTGNVLLGRLISLVLTTTLGSSALPYYELPQRLYTQVHGALAGQSQFLFPMLASYGKNTVAQINRVEDRLRWFIAVASGVCYCTIALLGPDFISIIINPEFANKIRPMLYLVCMQGFFEAQDIVPYYTSHAIGVGRPNAIIHLVRGICVALSALILIPRFSVLGATIAQLWVIPAIIVHLMWVQKIISPGSHCCTWVTSYSSPLAMILVWVIIALSIRSEFTSGFVTNCLAWLGGITGGVIVVSTIETRLFKNKERWATLRRLVLAPLARAGLCN